MKPKSISYLVVSASLTLFPWLAMAAQPADAAHTLRVDEAAHQLEAQTKVNPFDAIALNNEAVKQSRDGYQLEAAQQLLRAHKLDPDNKIIDRNLNELNAWMTKRASANGTPDSQVVTRTATQPEPPPLWGAPVASGVGRQQK